MRSAIVLVALALAACDESQVWHEVHPTLARMLHQQRGTPFDENTTFTDGRVMREPPAGAVPRGALEPPFKTPDGTWVDAFPMPVTRELVARGRNLFETTCAACHGVLGDANSVVASKMEFRKPRSLQEDAVRAYPVGRIYEVVAFGYGLMPSYTAQLSTPEDRWAVVAYLRALQLSQNARASELPPDLRAQLDRSAP